MSKEVFYKLLERYQEGKCSPEEKKIVEQWYGMLDDDELPEISAVELASIDVRMQNELHKKIDETPLPGQPQRRILKRWSVLAMAASVIGILIISSYFIKAPIKQPVFLGKAQSDIVEVVNTSHQTLTVVLADSSSVTLQPLASLKYPKMFSGNTREVHLTGNAFFEVSKDKDHPFVVFSNNLITQVLGTSFTITTDNATQRSEVAVRTGRVRVTKNISNQSLAQQILDKEEVVLLPNQRVVLPAAAAPFMVSLVDNPLPLANEDATIMANQFLFNETSLSGVFESLSKAYGIPISIDDPSVSNCRFTGDLTDAGMITQLEFVCKSTNLKYSITGTAIHIEGKGCPQ